MSFCPSKDIHSVYLDGELPENYKAEYELHISHCEKCRKELEQLGDPLLERISIDTVERYQGSQRDVIIYSFTIQQRYQLDFLTANSFDENGRIVDRKLNVALTRARRQLLLTGHPETLRQSPLFNRLMEYFKEKSEYITTDFLSNYVKID